MLQVMQDENVYRLIESLSQINVSLESLRVTMSGISEVSSDHEARLRKIEVWKHNLTPILAAITFTLGAIFTVALERVL